MRGHLWTILPHLRDGLAPPRSPGVAWSTNFHDPSSGSVTLSGILDEVAGADRLIVLVHGMGGNADKGYVMRAAGHARTQGLSSLRLNLRGADEHGRDIYHAGLVADLEAAIASPELARYEHIHVLGFSLGGHMVARYALAPAPRVRSVAALCSPLDLNAACQHIDAPMRYVYRRHLLAGLRRTAERAQSAGTHRFPIGNYQRIRRIRDWDNEVVAPRFGFADANDYYRQMSVGPDLGKLVIPSLFVFATEDPMIAKAAIQPALETQSSRVTVRQVPGGHVHTPARAGVIPSSLRWLRRHG